MRRSARNARTWPIVLAALVLVAAAVGLWLRMSTPDRPTVDAGRAVADSFLASIRDGKPDDAWQTTTADFKSFEGRENFRRRVAKAPSLKLPLQFVSAQTVAVGALSRDEYLYQAKTHANTMATVRILIGDENGEWKVDRLTTE